MAIFWCINVTVLVLEYRLSVLFPPMEKKPVACKKDIILFLVPFFVSPCGKTLVHSSYNITVFSHVEILKIVELT